MKREVALKVLRPTAIGDPAAKELFIREARAFLKSDDISNSKYLTWSSQNQKEKLAHPPWRKRSQK